MTSGGKEEAEPASDAGERKKKDSRNDATKGDDERGQRMWGEEEKKG